MAESKHNSPGKEAAKTQLQRTGTRRKAESDQDLSSQGFPMVSDTCSPSGATEAAQYDGESLDFGDDATNLV